jgi:hypothetical protein
MAMTEEEKLWLTTNDHPRPLMMMVGRIPFKTSLERKWRLLLCAWARRVAPVAEQPQTYTLLATAEQYADGIVLRSAVDELWLSAGQFGYGLDRGAHAFGAALATGFRSDSNDIFHSASEALDLAASASGKPETEWAVQAAIIKDVFGNPFHPSPPLPPAVLNWNDGTIRRIAQAIYEDRRMPEGTLDNARLAILSDALLDAGCDNEDLIQHCRSAGPHVRGCWAVDLILGKS